MSQSRNMTRRNLLKQTAGITAGLTTFPYFVPSACLGKAASVSPINKIVMGSIGVGGQGTHNTKAFLNNPAVRVVAVCDINQDRRQKAKNLVDKHYGDKGCAAFGDFRELLAREDIDAVMIATQDHWHALIATAAAKAGKDMYCEKPMGVSVVEGKAMRDEVRRYGRVFQMGTQQRSGRNFRFACELARNGYVGKIHTVKVAAPGPMYKRQYRKPPVEEPVPAGFDYDMYLGPAPKKPYNGGRWAFPDWYLTWDYCAGFIVNWGVHHLDIANWGCPAVGSESFDVECKGSYRNDGLTDNINDWQAKFTYASGIRMIYSDTGNPNKQGCQFEGDKGWVHVNRKGIWAEPASLLSVNIKPDETHLGDSTSHHVNFIDCVKTRNDPIAHVDEGHKASYLGLVPEIACRLKRELKWDSTKEQFINDRQANQMMNRPMRSPWHL